MISDQYKCIFLHANKCGGKSIEKTVWGVPVTWFMSISGTT